MKAAGGDVRNCWKKEKKKKYLGFERFRLKLLTLFTVQA